MEHWSVFLATPCKALVLCCSFDNRDSTLSTTHPQLPTYRNQVSRGSWIRSPALLVEAFGVPHRTGVRRLGEAVHPVSQQATSPFEPSACMRRAFAHHALFVRVATQLGLGTSSAPTTERPHVANVAGGARLVHRAENVPLPHGSLLATACVFSTPCRKSKINRNKRESFGIQISSLPGYSRSCLARRKDRHFSAFAATS